MTRERDEGSRHAGITTVEIVLMIGVLALIGILTTMVLAAM